MSEENYTRRALAIVQRITPAVMAAFEDLPEADRQLIVTPVILADDTGVTVRLTFERPHADMNYPN